MKLTVLVGLICIAVLSMVSLVSALPLATSGSVHVRNNAAGTGSDIIACLVGQQLWVFWTQSPDNTWVTVEVVNPDNVIMVNQANRVASDSGSITFTVVKAGTYWVLIRGANDAVIGSDIIASATVLLPLPESALGSLMAVATGLGAFALIGTAKTKKLKLN